MVLISDVHAHRCNLLHFPGLDLVSQAPELVLPNTLVNRSASHPVVETYCNSNSVFSSCPMTQKHGRSTCVRHAFTFLADLFAACHSDSHASFVHASGPGWKRPGREAAKDGSQLVKGAAICGLREEAAQKRKRFRT